MEPTYSSKVQYIQNISIGIAGRNLFSFQSVKYENTVQNLQINSENSGINPENQSVLDVGGNCEAKSQNYQINYEKDVPENDVYHSLITTGTHANTTENLQSVASERRMYDNNGESISIYYDANSMDYNVNINNNKVSKNDHQNVETTEDTSKVQDRIQLIQFNNVIYDNNEENINSNNITELTDFNITYEAEPNTEISSVFDENTQDLSSTSERVTPKTDSDVDFGNSDTENDVQSEIYENFHITCKDTTTETNKHMPVDRLKDWVVLGNEEKPAQVLDNKIEIETLQNINTNSTSLLNLNEQISVPFADSTKDSFIYEKSDMRIDSNVTSTTYLDKIFKDLVINNEKQAIILDKFESMFFILDDIKDIIAEFADEFEEVNDESNQTISLDDEFVLVGSVNDTGDKKSLELNFNDDFDSVNDENAQNICLNSEFVLVDSINETVTQNGSSESKQDDLCQEIADSLVNKDNYNSISDQNQNKEYDADHKDTDNKITEENLPNVLIFSRDKVISVVENFDSMFDVIDEMNKIVFDVIASDTTVKYENTEQNIQINSEHSELNLENQSVLDVGGNCEAKTQNYQINYEKDVPENDVYHSVITTENGMHPNTTENLQSVASERQMYDNNEECISIYYDANSMDYNVNINNSKVSKKDHQSVETTEETSKLQDRIQLIQFNNVIYDNNEENIDKSNNTKEFTDFNITDKAESNTEISSGFYENSQDVSSASERVTPKTDSDTDFGNSDTENDAQSEIYENFHTTCKDTTTETNKLTPADSLKDWVVLGNEEKPAQGLDNEIEIETLQNINTNSTSLLNWNEQIYTDSTKDSFIYENSDMRIDDKTSTTYLDKISKDLVINKEKQAIILDKFESMFFILDDIKDIIAEFADEFEEVNDESNQTISLDAEFVLIGSVNDTRDQKSLELNFNDDFASVNDEDAQNICLNSESVLVDSINATVPQIASLESKQDAICQEIADSLVNIDNNNSISEQNQNKEYDADHEAKDKIITDEIFPKVLIFSRDKVISIVDNFDSMFDVIDEMNKIVLDVVTSDDDDQVDGTSEVLFAGSYFDETGFVETLTPQYTPGQSITSPQPVAAAVEDKLANLQAQQEITQLKTEVEDLKEKLETLKVKRAEDREKLRELERVRLQLEQANEFKTRIMESQAQLQRDLQRAKQETREAQEALEQHQEETAELHEATEMAALDKEMAEERAEAIQLELEQCREKLEEATLDLQLMKAEMEAAGNSQHPYAAAEGGYEMRQLQQQNARLRETLLRLRDLSAHDKHQLQRTHKDLEQSKSEVAELSRTKEKLSTRIEELEEQVGDLQEQVDAALGAEEMLSQLADRKMELEDQVERLKQDVSELEALQEVHEQLVESDRELEMDLREELEMAHAATREAVREREAALETLMDRDATIIKFRELVQKMTEQYNELRSNSDKQGSPSSSEHSGTPEPTKPVELPVVAEWRGATRSIDLQLRALDLSQALARAEALARALPDHYMKSEGDHDAILLILLLQRLDTKCEIILGQIRERFPAVNVWDREVIMKTHTAVQYSFRCQLEYLLRMIQCVVSMWSETLDACTPELLLRAASALPDALQQEKALDAALQLLKTNELDENCQLDAIERCLSYLSALWSTLGGGQAGVSRRAVTHAAAALEANARALHADAAALQAVAPSELGDEAADIQQVIKSNSETLQMMLKSIRRRIPPGAQLGAAGLDEQLITRLRTERATSLYQVARCAWLASRAACAAAPPPPSQAWRAAAAVVYRQDDPPLKLIKQALSSVATDVSTLAAFVQEKEYDMMSNTNVPVEKPTPPVVIRAQLVKKQLEETKTLTIKLENKEADIKELKKLLKATKEELSEMQIRRELGERKLTSTARDAELKAEQLQRKLEDATNALKRKEKEFEETMDHLQKDIDSLESERGALRDKLKLYAKRGSGHHEETPVKVSSGLPTGGASEALQHQLKVLSWTVDRERAARIAACKRAEMTSLRSLRPLENPASAGNTARRLAANRLQAELTKLQTEWTMFVARSGLVKFPEDPSKYARALQMHKEKQREIRRQLEERLMNLQATVQSELLAHRPWRCVEASFANFPAPELTRALQNKSVEIGTIQVPANPDLSNEDTIYVTPAQLARLRELVTELHSDDVKLDLTPLDATVCAA